MRVLHVESHPETIADVRRALRREGSNVESLAVGSGQEALAVLAKSRYDVVLTALPLADGDGIELVDEIRRRGHPVAVVVVVALGADDDALVALKAGADDYVVMRDAYLLRLPLVLEGAVRRFSLERARRGRPIRVLYAEDEPDDLALTIFHLANLAPHIRIEGVATASEALQRLPVLGEPSHWDLLLLDYRLPGMSAIEMLKHLRETRHVDIPMIVVTGQGDEDVALQALKLGASDYLVKNPGYLHHLAPTLERAFYRAELLRETAALRASEERSRLLVDGVRDHAIYLVDPYGIVATWNDGAAHLFGYEASEVLGSSIDRFYPLSDTESANGAAAHLLAAAVDGRVEYEGRFIRKDGEHFWANVVMTSLRETVPGHAGGYAVVTQDRTERRRLERAREALLEEVREGRDQLRYLSRRLLEAQEAERRAIARDLHDEIGQALVAVKLGMEAVVTEGDGPTREQAGAVCRETLDGVLNHVRSLSFDLRPALLEDLGLEAAIRWHVRRQSERGDFIPELAVGPIPRSLPAEVGVACFRIVQEALANVVRHADASRVRIQIELQDGALTIDLRDDGIGFDVGATEASCATDRGTGLMILRERAILLGGTLSVRSEPGGGTHVRAVLPYSAA